MEPVIARKLAAEVGINVEFVVREFWELAVLEVLLGTGVGNRLVFKGGTALRLAYGSPRFSDDLGFSLLKKVSFPEFEAAVRQVARRYPELELTDLATKRRTFLAEFRVRDPAIERPVRQVVEVSRRNPGSLESELRLLSSPCSPLRVLALVATPEAIWREKLAALKSRKAPRDLFDLWFLGQTLARQLPDDVPEFDPRVLRRELRMYLPRKFYPVVEELAR
jgi:predicted nucleotidyltransferase component of viral defense system